MPTEAGEQDGNSQSHVEQSRGLGSQEIQFPEVEFAYPKWYLNCNAALKVRRTQAKFALMPKQKLEAIREQARLRRPRAKRAFDPNPDPACPAVRYALKQFLSLPLLPELRSLATDYALSSVHVRSIAPVQAPDSPPPVQKLSLPWLPASSWMSTERLLEQLDNYEQLPEATDHLHTRLYCPYSHLLSIKLTTVSQDWTAAWFGKVTRSSNIDLLFSLCGFSAKTDENPSTPCYQELRRYTDSPPSPTAYTASSSLDKASRLIAEVLIRQLFRFKKKLLPCRDISAEQNPSENSRFFRAHLLLRSPLYSALEMPLSPSKLTARASGPTAPCCDIVCRNWLPWVKFGRNQCGKFKSRGLLQNEVEVVEATALRYLVLSGCSGSGPRTVYLRLVRAELAGSQKPSQTTSWSDGIVKPFGISKWGFLLSSPRLTVEKAMLAFSVRLLLRHPCPFLSSRLSLSRLRPILGFSYRPTMDLDLSASVRRLPCSTDFSVGKTDHSVGAFDVQSRRSVPFAPDWILTQVASLSLFFQRIIKCTNRDPFEAESPNQNVPGVPRSKHRRYTRELRYQHLPSTFPPWTPSRVVCSRTKLSSSIVDCSFD